MKSQAKVRKGIISQVEEFKKVGIFLNVGRGHETRNDGWMSSASAAGAAVPTVLW